MLTKEDLQLLSGLIDDKLQPINQRFDEMQWVDVNFRHTYPFLVDRDVV